ncbi:MAG: SRPBCC domain-containing protein [Haliscomenobacter sp.]|nr:SRPBCC domain-containing protein [Haliscomenobacter sp.]MBK9489383.1 SRPBCC domain-containing protein [Haliscomenobacter sp.]
MAHPTKVIAEAGKQELFVIREFDAPRELVFQAFSDPAILVQFFAPNRAIMTFDYADYRTGGAYRYTHTEPQGRVLCTFKGIIHELAAPERIIQTAELEGLPEPGHVILEAMLFETLPENRSKLIIHDVCLSVEDRDAMIRSGMEGGLAKIFNQLDDLLRKGF